MTYGEYYYRIKYAINLQDGKWITNKPTMTVPKQMSKEEALIYYNTKFCEYWKEVKKS
ncbi:MAG: hypothetical protein J7K14_01175 [Sulfurimonas sp.]|nr:hypothetical protein [Sulfurimonas sp.]